METNNLFKKLAAMSALALMTILFTASPAQAQSLYYTGFEKLGGFTFNRGPVDITIQAGFNVGALDGQNGWTASSNVAIENTIVDEGTQALEVSLNNLSGYGSNFESANSPVQTPGTNRYAVVSVAFRRDQLNNIAQS